MTAIVKTPFNTATRRFKPGDVVTVEEVGEVLFALHCEPPKPVKVKVEAPAPDKE